MKTSDLTKMASRASNVLGKAEKLVTQAGYKLIEVEGLVNKGVQKTTATWAQGDVRVCLNVLPAGWQWSVESLGLDQSFVTTAKGASDNYRSGWTKFTGAMRKAAI